MSGHRPGSRRALLATMVCACTGALLTATGCRSRTPRAEAPPPATWRAPFGPRFVLIVDPGHGGEDSGTRAANGLLEKDLTLDVARRLRARLADVGGIDVVLTREHDIRLSRDERVAAVRAAEADLLLSLHFNDLPERHIALVETYYAHARNIVDSRRRRRAEAARSGARVSLDPVDPDEPEDVSFTRGSERFAAFVQRHVFAAVERGSRQAVNAGTKRDTLFVLTRAGTSGALVELTCLSNDGEAARLAGERYRDELAAALATAVEAHRASSNVIAPVVPAD